MTTDEEERAHGGHFAFDFGAPVHVTDAVGGASWRAVVRGRSRDDEGREWYAVMPDEGDRTQMVPGESMMSAP